jgi:hypothetical protein
LDKLGSSQKLNRFVHSWKRRATGQQTSLVVRFVPLSDICTAANGIDALPLITIPLSYFVGTSPRNNAALSTKSFLLRRENTMKRTPDIERMDQPMRVVICSDQRRNVNLLTSVFSEMRDDLYLIKQRGSIMWTRYEFVSYSFLVAVTVSGLGLLTTLFF